MKSPKLKAEELVEEMMLYSYEKKDRDNDYAQYIVDYKVKKEYAIQCTLIAVKEIISLMIKIHGRHIENNLHEIDYWREVKNELLNYKL